MLLLSQKQVNSFIRVSLQLSGYQWRSQPRNLRGAKMSDFRRITLFCLEKRLSKHKMTICSKNVGGTWPLCPLATPMVGSNDFKSASLVSVLEMSIWEHFLKSLSHFCPHSGFMLQPTGSFCHVMVAKKQFSSSFSVWRCPKTWCYQVQWSKESWLIFTKQSCRPHFYVGPFDRAHLCSSFPRYTYGIYPLHLD